MQIHTTHTPDQMPRPSWSIDTLFEHSPDLLCMTDLAGYLRRVNPAWSQAMGYAQTALPAEPLFRLVYADDQERLQAVFADAAATGELRTITVRCPGAGGAQRWVEWQISADAGLGLVSALGRDISDEHARAQQLRLFETLVQHMPDAVTVTSLDRQVIYTNPSFRRMIGAEADQASIAPDDSLDPPEVERMRSEVLPALRTKKTWRGRVRHRRRDGSTFPSDSLAFVIHDAQGSAQSVAIVMRDVTEQERVEQERAHTASLLQATLESTSDGVLAVDTAGNVVNINQQFITLWRIPAALVATGDDAKLLQFVVDQLADPAAFIAKVNELYDQPNATSYDILSFKDGRVFERYSHPQRIDGVSIGRVWNFRDITDRQRAEVERLALQEQVIIAQQERLRELSTPLIPIADGVVVMPLIGALDSTRAQQVLETLLTGVAERRAQVAILDITGVLVVDTQVANALLRAAQAVRLLGARVVLTGIKPEVAQTLVNLGADLRGIVTRGSLQSGIAFALQQR